MSKAILCWDGPTWHLRFPAPRKGAICGVFGSWQTEAAAEAAATGDWEGAVPVIGHTPHVWKTCPCKRCQGQREASNYYRFLEGKSFEDFSSK